MAERRHSKEDAKSEARAPMGENRAGDERAGDTGRMVGRGGSYASPGGTGATGGTSFGRPGGIVGGTYHQYPLEDALDLVDFPATRDQVLEAVGTLTFDANGRQRPARDLIGRIRKDRFMDKDEVLSEINRLPEMRGEPPEGPAGGDYF